APSAKREGPIRHLGAERLGRFAIDDEFGFARAGTAGPSGRSFLSARRQHFCCFRCLVACRSGTASGKWTPRSKPELCGIPCSLLAQNRRSGGRTASLGWTSREAFRQVFSKQAFSALFQLHLPSVRRSSPLPKAVPSIH